MYLGNLHAGHGLGKTKLIDTILPPTLHITTQKTTVDSLVILDSKRIAIFRH